MKIKILLLAAIVASPSAWAGAAAARAAFQRTIQNYQTNSTPDTSGQYVNYQGRGAGTVRNVEKNSAAAIKEAPTQSTMNKGSKVGSGSQKSGSMINMAAAAALMAGCLAPCPKCATSLCAMSALSMLQAGHDSGAADMSDLTGSDSGVGNVDDPTGGSDGGVDPQSVRAGTYSDPNIQAGFDKLKNEGYKVTSESVTFPDGTVMKASDFNSASSMLAAGMSPSAVKEAQAVLAAVNDEINKVSGGAPNVGSVAVDGGGGGGGSAIGDESENQVAVAANPFALDGDRKKQLVAGKTVSFDGEPIGVRGQNIFEMVHNCYQKKVKANAFIETENEVSARAPASVKKK